MQCAKLGKTDLSVSRCCLGTMTWGRQNTQNDANEQIGYALSQGVNFIDTAEMYAVPPTEETYGKTEEIIGNWIAANPSRRDDFVLASKIAGPGFPYIRDSGPITGDVIESSIDASLKRLQTDYIDLYQLHWPNRQSPHFANHHPGKISFEPVGTEQQLAEFAAILEALQVCIDAGKIRYFGVSNETPWGVNAYLRLSKELGLPRVASVQNEYSLLHSKDWPYMMETLVHEEVGYLAWSPLAGGALTGKYIDGARPDGSRWTIAQRQGIFRDTELSNKAVKAYKEVADAHGLSLAQIALAWCDQTEGVTSTIIGATTLEQLKENITAFDLVLSEAVIADLSEVKSRYSVPF